MNYAVHRTCYVILFMYAGPYELYICIVCSVDYLLTNAGTYACYSGYKTWLYLILLCGTVH